MQMLLNNRYRVIRTLGGGGFGETFLAEDTQMPSSRRCVIKQLRPIQNNPEVYQLVQQRFQREAAILEELGDSNNQIPRLYAYFTENGQFYLVQEYIEGQTLSAKLQQQGLMSQSSVKETLYSILPVLDYVHSKGIVHRDIKPDNILIRYSDGKPILIDFGAVKETIGTVVSPSGNSTRSIVIGTPGYMPSEQSVGRPMFASDIYSLGLTAIYLLTGKVPQELPTDPSTGSIFWRQHAPSISPSFALVLDKAIQFNPRDRFGSAREMLHALQTGSSTVPPTYGVPIAPTEPYIQPHQINPPPRQQTPEKTPEKTLAVGSASSQPPQNYNQNNGQNNGNRGINPGFLIAGGLIGASVIIGFVLSRQPQQIAQSPSTPIPVQTEDNSQTSTTVKKPIPSDNSQPPVEPKPSNTSKPQETPAPVTTPTPTPTQSSQPSPSTPPVDRPSPEQFIQNYYETINQGQFKTSWSELAPTFQNNTKVHPQGYASYIDWWGGHVQHVDINGVNLVEKNSDTATADAQLKYILKTGKTANSTIRLTLVWDAVNKRWLIAGAK